ncbi:MAG: hypothetical protein HYX66_09545 [Ignavibacteria bacterium]|nr:hypothetical protein [Ignavibacteria bacterium]
MKMLTLVQAAIFLALTFVSSQTEQWPRSFTGSKGTITIYDPEAVNFQGGVLEGRDAISFSTSETSMIFGALSFSAAFSKVGTTDSLIMKSFTITAMRLPGVDDATLFVVKQEIEAEILGWRVKTTAAHLSDGIKSGSGGIASKDLNTDSPKILVRYQTAQLVIVDGDLIWEKINDTDIKYVVNSSSPMFSDVVTEKYYLWLGKNWYSSKVITGPWSLSVSTPNYITGLIDSSDSPSQERSKPVKEIIVTDKPSELISFDGQPAWEPLSGNDLLYANNTANDVFMEIASQRYFVVFNGRWYSSTALDGQWEYRAANALPTSFSQIDSGSAKGHLLKFVAGTPQSRNAVLDAQIPTVAAVEKSKATLAVTYKGDPWFENVSGTNMKYAVNASTTVILSDNRYYACDNGIWFVSASATGPWIVSDSRPDEVDNIPSSSPVYNVKYVYVYSATPSYVYVGYTPGYHGVYVYNAAVVYGTGWHYNAWYGHHYYPMYYPPGFHVYYRPHSYHGYAYHAPYHGYTPSHSVPRHSVGRPAPVYRHSTPAFSPSSHSSSPASGHGGRSSGRHR